LGVKRVYREIPAECGERKKSKGSLSREVLLLKRNGSRNKGEEMDRSDDEADDGGII